MTPRDEEYDEYGATRMSEGEALSGKSTAELEEEINQIRAEMDSTLDAIERRFSPSALLDQALHSLKGGPMQFANNLGTSIRDNPVPVALLGIGLGWLFLSEAGVTRATGEKAGAWRQSGSRSLDRARDKMHETSRSLSERLHHTSDKMHEASRSVSDRLHRTGEKMREVGEKAGSRRERMGEAAAGFRVRARQARSDIRQVRRESPLLFAAVGIAAGLIFGALLPVTRKEKEILGETGAEMRTRAREIARKQVEKGEQIAGAAVEAAREETERQFH